MTEGYFYTFIYPAIKEQIEEKAKACAAFYMFVIPNLQEQVKESTISRG